MKRLALWPLTAAFWAAGVGATTEIRATPKPAIGTICSRPGEACDASYKGFAPHELPFRLPRELRANTPIRSAPFYAVILKRRMGREDDCDGGEWTKADERERRQFQSEFSQRKVFAAPQCPDMSAVSYFIDGQNSTEVFLAVYAGQTRASGAAVLSQVHKRFKNAKIQRMSVSFERIIQ